MFVCPECGQAQPAPGHCPADGTLVAPIGEDVLLGTTIGAYRVARLLGIGGMGRVYKGVHPTIGSRRSAASASSVSCMIRITWS